MVHESATLDLMSEPFDITTNPIHLGLGARAFPLPVFDGSPEWYGRYGADVASDGAEGRLVTLHSFDASWTVWEMHPVGEEVVLCLDGEVTLHQELDGDVATVTLTANQAVINPAGVWHTADVEGSATCLFVTAGMGTEHRER